MHENKVLRFVHGLVLRRLVPRSLLLRHWGMMNGEAYKWDTAVTASSVEMKAEWMIYETTMKHILSIR